MASLNVIGLTTTMLPSNGTDIMVNKEMQVETVIVILWISGGVLLIALIILLACILRTNKKGRRRSNPLRPGVFRVLESANGGVNPSYTSYDEIWTWIPVVRGDEASCPPRQETSRNVTISPASTSLASNLEPPPYSVAISTPSRPHSIPRYSSAAMAVSTATTSSYGNPVSNIASTVSISADRSGQTIVNSCSPVISSHAQRGRHHTSHNAQITSTSGHIFTSTPISSPRINQRVMGRNEPIRNPVINSNHGNSTCSQFERNQRPQSCYEHPNDDVRSPLPNRRSLFGEDPTRLYSNRDRIHRNDIPTASPCQGNTQVETPPFTYDPEEGVYSYLAGSIGRRIWCDIPPSLLDEDGPPPYTRNADLRSREYYQRRPRTDRPAPLVRLEYDYF
ncbi:uncharacterized protein LOC127731689 isoform X1 [Mytilus californianus]|uniref:uncharacterized protein LOC127731689 isoform X1 n=1 Tax=Mytilus californianus TaxID=6549 RepID=UPI002247DADB|nr:uncharacterized protein LOC127731689 isoform X1 [Mytilus californianus]